MLNSVGSRRASFRLHALLLSTAVHLPMMFFEITPVGRLMNLFSKDIDTIDINIPSNMEAFFHCVIKVIGTVTVISTATPLILITAVPLVVLYIFIQVAVSYSVLSLSQCLYACE